MVLLPSVPLPMPPSMVQPTGQQMAAVPQPQCGGMAPVAYQQQPMAMGVAAYAQQPMAAQPMQQQMVQPMPYFMIHALASMRNSSVDS